MSRKTEKLELFEVKDGKRQGLSIQVALSSVSVEKGLEYITDDPRENGSLKREKLYHSVPSSLYSFVFTLDGTGVLKSGDKGVESVLTIVEKIREITQTFDGSVHEPRRVDLVWGSNVVTGRVISMSISYTLFTPTGAPLRAKVSLVVEDSVNKEVPDEEKPRQSPDLTRLNRY